MTQHENRVYETRPATSHWQIGIYLERGLLHDGDITWEDVATAHNQYYGCRTSSPLYLHVDEDGNAYRITREQP